MSTDPRLYRQFLLLIVEQGDARKLAAHFHLSLSSVYRLARRGVRDQAIAKVSECLYTPGPRWAVFVDHIDTAYGGLSDSQALSEPGLQPDNLPRAPAIHLLPNWTNTGAQCTYYIHLPVPPAFAVLFRRWGPNYRHQRKYPQGTAQFYLGKTGGSVVLHLKDLWVPDGMEERVPDMQRSLFRAWVRQIIEDYPGLRIWDRPIFHPDPKAQESRTPLPTGELNKRILGVETVARERVAAATETNNSPPGPSLETAGIEEARTIAQAPFALADLRRDMAEVKEALGALASSFKEFAGVMRDAFPKKPAEPAGPAPPADDRRGYG